MCMRGCVRCVWEGEHVLVFVCVGSVSVCLRGLGKWVDWCAYVDIV